MCIRDREKVDYSTEIEKLNIEKEKIESKLNNLVEMRLDGDISKAVYNDKKTTLRQQMEYCDSQIVELSNKEQGMNPVEFQIELLKGLLDSEFDAVKGKIPKDLIEAFIEKNCCS